MVVAVVCNPGRGEPFYHADPSCRRLVKGGAVVHTMQQAVAEGLRTCDFVSQTGEACWVPMGYVVRGTE